MAEVKVGHDEMDAESMLCLNYNEEVGHDNIPWMATESRGQDPVEPSPCGQAHGSIW
jgi:hypothetical protein